ncbi:MAG: hypothetical protein U1E41_03155 [Paracoccus sp. (in: a-proteobacteria)]
MSKTRAKDAGQIYSYLPARIFDPEAFPRAGRHGGHYEAALTLLETLREAFSDKVRLAARQNRLGDQRHQAARPAGAAQVSAAPIRARPG